MAVVVDTRWLFVAHPVFDRRVSASACRGGGYAEFRLLLHVVVFERKTRYYLAPITVRCVRLVRLESASGSVSSACAGLCWGEGNWVC